jgi:hypothetical protein
LAASFAVRSWAFLRYRSLVLLRFGVTSLGELQHHILSQTRPASDHWRIGV